MPLFLKATSATSGDAEWGSGVEGPESSTNNALPRFDGTSGTSVKNTGIVVDDSNNVTGMGMLNGITLTQIPLSTDIDTIVTISQADYDLLAPPDPRTLYLITS